MALNDSATLVIGAGNFYTAAVGTARPASVLAPGVAWSKVGHTSIQDILGTSSNGGDVTVLGTLQNKALRSTIAARTEIFNFTIQQFDEGALKLYYGANAPVLPDGTVGVPTDPEPTQCAWLAVFVDGDNHFDFYCPKAEIFRGDDLALSDTESLSGLPLAVTPLVYSSNTYAYTVSPLGRPNATGATAGTPGSYTPSGAQPPYALADLTGILASPTSAWTTGQNIVLGDGSLAHWSGSAWVTGAA